MAKVYFHRKATDNLVFYVGISVLENTNREYEETNRNKYWHNTVKKNGFIVETVHKGISEESAKNAEKYYISLFGRKDLKTGCLVNMTNGGQGMNGYKHSDETRQKMKNTKKYIRKQIMTEEAKKHLSEYNSKKYRDKRIEYFNSNININNCNSIKFIEDRNVWESSILLKTKLIFIGYFNTKEDAYKKYVEYYEKYIINKERVTPIKVNNKSSKYRGVSFCKETNKWVAQKTINYKNFLIGKYYTEHEAYAAYLTFTPPKHKIIKIIINTNTKEEFLSLKDAAKSIGMGYTRFKENFRPIRTNKTGFIIEKRVVETTLAN